MKKEVRISHEENENIYILFSTYNAYMSMLEYLAQTQDVVNSPIYEKKWNETAAVWIELDEAKKAAERKYKPEGNWDRFEFDFENDMMVFTNDS